METRKAQRRLRLGTLPLIVTTLAALSLSLGSGAAADTTDADNSIALSIANELRGNAGLQPLVANLGLTQAARSHAQFLARNHEDPRLQGLGAHGEYPDLPGFTAANMYDRCTIAGGPSCTEVIAFAGDPASAISAWMRTVYHRTVFFKSGRRPSAGYARVTGPDYRVDVMEFSLGGLCDEFGPPYPVAVWPHDGMTNVPTTRLDDLPPPLRVRDRPDESTGYPITVSGLTGGFQDLTGFTNFTLTDQRGAEIPTFESTDYDNHARIPTKPLLPGTLYRVNAQIRSCALVTSRSWSFTTAATTESPPPVPLGSARRVLRETLLKAKDLPIDGYAQRDEWETAAEGDGSMGALRQFEPATPITLVLRGVGGAVRAEPSLEFDWIAVKLFPLVDDAGIWVQRRSCMWTGQVSTGDTRDVAVTSLGNASRGCRFDFGASNSPVWKIYAGVGTWGIVVEATASSAQTDDHVMGILSQVAQRQLAIAASAPMPEAPTWHSQWIAQSDYLVMRPTQTATFWIRFRNVGTEPWERGIWTRQVNLALNGDNKEPFRLGMAFGWLWDDRLATSTAQLVMPGEIAEFQFGVRAPANPGVYRLQLRPVVDGRTWLEDEGVFWIIDVR